MDISPLKSSYAEPPPLPTLLSGGYYCTADPLRLNNSNDKPKSVLIR